MDTVDLLEGCYKQLCPDSFVSILGGVDAYGHHHEFAQIEEEKTL